MDKITDKIAALPPDADYISLEFFPPKTAMGFANLRSRLERMARALKPVFVNVTWGAGGSTSQKSLELAEICQRELGLTTCLHLTCTNMSKRMIDKALEDAKVLGIRNILALRGDPPRRAEYRDENQEEDMDGGEEFNLAVDLVKYIQKAHGNYFCIGVAGYPEGHADESHPLGQSMERDLPFLVEKVQAGADFIMTQLFFDIKAYDKFEKALREHPSGAFKNTIIIPGLMPVQNFQMIKRTTKLSHAKIPDQLLARLEEVRQDDEKVKEVGVDLLSELVEQVREIKSRTPGPKGFHFYTLNLEKAVSFIVERTNLIAPDAPDDNAAVDDLAAVVPNITINGTANGSGSSHSIPTPQHHLSVGDHTSRRSSNNFPESRNRVIISSERTPSNPEYEATQLEASRSHLPVQSRSNTLAISEGEGVMGREATWDDFPNGRWGDARSPAYGEIDGYGVSLHMSVTQAKALWGEPKTPEEITKLFIQHLQGHLRAIPWSEEDFNPETDMIRDNLVALNQRGWWTVASQPAVNGVRSNHPVFGWGPVNGFIFQKAFVEVFLPRDDWKRLHEKLSQPEMKDVAWFYAVNAQGDFLSTDFSSGDDETEGHETGVNAVTWGVFPQKEIITPTIIEEVSFRAWGEEAFNIWGEWAQVYGKDSESERLLEKLEGELWLVNVIHHEYLDSEALWDLLTHA